MTKKQDRDPAPGVQLFHQASDFYSWYMSWSPSPTADAKVFQTLSKLMRIGKISSEGGKFLSSQEENLVTSHLHKLKEQLCDGTLKKDATLPELHSLVHNIISYNPKAKVISYATELEYHFCILKPPSTESEFLKTYLEMLLGQVNPSLLEIQAYAISQIMGKILENPTQHKNAGKLLEQELHQWLRASEPSISRSNVRQLRES